MKSPTWTSQDAPAFYRPKGADWFRVALRGALIFAMILIGLVVLIPVRFVERLFTGKKRPVSGWIPVWVCRGALAALGLGRETQGQRRRNASIIVSNHLSWLDIFVLNAQAPLIFVAKADVAGWPWIGILAQATGTIFIKRDRREAKAQKTLLADYLKSHQTILFFPEGTSSDGQRVLPFKSALFEALFGAGQPDNHIVQPVTLNYAAPQGEDARFYGWWGDMTFASHALGMLAFAPHGHVQLVWHPALALRDHPDRKAIALAAETAVRDALTQLETVPMSADPS